MAQEGLQSPRLGQGAEELQRVSRTGGHGRLAKAGQQAEVARCEDEQRARSYKLQNGRPFTWIWTRYQCVGSIGGEPSKSR